MSIPSSAIKFYYNSSCAPQYEIPSGPNAAGGLPIYPKVFPYFDSEHGVDVTIPYTGRLSSAGSRSISVSGKSIPITCTIPAVGELFAVTSVSHGIVGGSIMLESGSSHVAISGYSNTKFLYAEATINSPDGIGNIITNPIVSISARGASGNTLLQIPDDSGAACKYSFTISFDVAYIGTSSTTPSYSVVGGITIYNANGGSSLYSKTISVKQTYTTPITVYNNEPSLPITVRVGSRITGSTSEISWSGYSIVQYSNSGELYIPGILYNTGYNIYIQMASGTSDMFAYKDGLFLYQSFGSELSFTCTPVTSTVHALRAYIGVVTASIRIHVDSGKLADFIVGVQSYNDSNDHTFTGITPSGSFEISASVALPAIGVYSQECIPAMDVSDVQSQDENGCVYIVEMGEPPTSDSYDIRVWDDQN